MIRFLRHRLLLLAALAAGLVPTVGLVGLASAQDAGGDTTAVAINTRDGSSLFRLAFQIRRVTGDVVDNTNAAVAYASCTECQTVAISIQVLLIAGSPDTVSPENLAIAINQDCELCSTLASAYQFAIGTQTRLRFTAAGSQQIAQLRRQLEELRNSGLSIGEIQAKVDGITSQLSDVLSTEVVPVGAGEKAEPDPKSASGDATPTPAETTPSGTTAPEPAEGTTGPSAGAPTSSTPAETTTTPTTTSTGPAETTPTTTSP